MRAGSTAVDLSIADAQPTVLVGSFNGTNATSAADALLAAQDAQTLRLYALTQTLQALAASGELATKLNLPILSVAFQPLPYNLSTTGAPPGSVPVVVSAPASASSSSNTLSVGAIVGIAVGGAVALLLIAVVAVVVVRAQRKADPAALVTHNSAARGSFETYGSGDPVKSASQEGREGWGAALAPRLPPSPLLPLQCTRTATTSAAQ